MNFCCSITQSCLTLCNPMDCSMIGFPVLHHLLELAQIHVNYVGDAANHFHLCRPLLLLLSIIPSNEIFSNELALCITWQKYWRFSFRISPSKEYSGFISLGIDWFDLLAVQGTFKSLLQHHSSKVSIGQCSAFFMVQLSPLNLTTRKTIALTRWIIVINTSVFNMLSRLVIAFHQRSKHDLILWLPSPSAVTLELKKI